MLNGTSINIGKVIKRVVSTEEFFHNNMLGLRDATWEDFGYPQWHLVLCLAIAWTISFLCVTKGVKTMAKIVYFTAIFPYVILIILFVRAVSLEGSWTGILWYITPQLESLTTPTIWGDASSQIFFSFGIGVGSLVTLASYNKVSNEAKTFKNFSDPKLSAVQQQLPQRLHLHLDCEFSHGGYGELRRVRRFGIPREQHERRDR